MILDPVPVEAHSGRPREGKVARKLTPMFLLPESMNHLAQRVGANG
jgi:hypothetical protein